MFSFHSIQSTAVDIDLREGLGTMANNLDVMAARKTLMGLKILEESHQIPTEVSEPLLHNK